MFSKLQPRPVRRRSICQRLLLRRMSWISLEVLRTTSLWFVQSGNDLKIDVLGTTNSGNVANWFGTGVHPLQEITAGGMKLDSQISQLVQAMATYSANNSGFDPTSPSITAVPSDTSLQNSLAAAWHS